MPIEPLALGVCSWSLQPKSIPELTRLMDSLGVDVVQIACGDPHHADWDEGDSMPPAAKAAGFRMSGAMLGFPGEDYTTPQTIQRTGGFGPKELRAERLDRFRWALDRVKQLGLGDLMLHAGFLPHEGDPDREPMLDVLGQVSDLAKTAGVMVAFETGQETASLLRKTLDDLKSPNVKVNFDPANMLLYDMGDPIRAVELLGPDIRSVHVKDANRPTVKGQWGEEVPLGKGQVNIRAFVAALQRVGYRGPLCIEREVGDQAGRCATSSTGLTICANALPIEASIFEFSVGLWQKRARDQCDEHRDERHGRRRECESRWQRVSGHK